jgi:uncharacterized membrane protein YccC
MQFSENETQSQRPNTRERLVAIVVGGLMGIAIAAFGYFLTRSLWCLLAVPIVAYFAHSLKTEFPATWSRRNSAEGSDSGESR